ncbi:uncharacterized protein (DUF2336 family) [Bradyrhizobium sp. USDA 4472]
MVAAALPKLITELDAAVRTAPPERGDRILSQLTNLFLSNVDCLGEAQLGVLDDVFIRLAESTGARSLAQLSEVLSKIEGAPPQTVRKLAFHSDPLVATPVLRNSSRLSEKDLIEVAMTQSQQHLLAISQRSKLHEALTDVIIRRGDASVSRALALNPGATFSECGYATLVGRAERDESLVEKLGLRLDVPAVLLRELLAMATDVVRARFLTARRPIARKKGAVETVRSRPKTDYTKAQNEVLALNRAAKLNKSAVNRFAISGDYTKVLASLSFMADVAIDVIEPFFESDRLYALIVTCKAARLDWATTTMIVRNRPGCPPLSSQEIEQAREIFDALLLSIAQWTVRFAADGIDTNRSTPAK